jgi:hypothetical protein
VVTKSFFGAYNFDTVDGIIDMLEAAKIDELFEKQKGKNKL